MTDQNPVSPEPPLEPSDVTGAVDHEKETVEAMTAMFGRMARHLTVFLGVLAAVSVGLGWLTAGRPGVWAALLGSGIALLFVVSTAVLGRVTAHQPTSVASMALLGLWVFKMAALLVVIVVVRDMDFYNPVVLFVTVVAAILGSTAIEVREAIRARVPYVTPSAR